MSGFDWQYLGAGELIVEIGQADISRVTTDLGKEWTWDSEEYGVITDEDGTVTEWMTLHGARRRSLTAATNLEEQQAA